MQTDYARHLPLPDTHNIRDLGGYSRIADGTTQWRRLLRGDSLAYLAPASRDKLLVDGLSMVIDLRGPHELASEPNPFPAGTGVLYRNIALFDAMMPIAMASTPFDMAARYRDALDLCGDRLAQVLRDIAEAPAGMVLFHCTAGKDRTGIVAALLLLLADVSQDDIVADYALTATLAAPMLRRLRLAGEARNADPAHLDLVLASDAATMRAMLAHLHDRHGSAANYCAAIGLDSGEIDRVVARLCS